MEKHPEEKTAPILNEDSNLFSLEQLNRIGNNDKNFIIKMLEKFLVSVSECTDTIAPALSQNDWSKIKIAAHKSMPSYSIMGLTELAKDLAYIEKYAGNKEYHREVFELINLIEKKNKKLIQDIKNYLKALTQGDEV